MSNNDEIMMMKMEILKKYLLKEVELKDLTTLSEDGNSMNLSYSCTKVNMNIII